MKLESGLERQRSKRAASEVQWSAIGRNLAGVYDPQEWKSAPSAKECSIKASKGKTMTTFPRLSSTKLVVDDLESTKAFYCEAYGFEVRGRIQAEMLGEPIDEYLLGTKDAPEVPLILMKYIERDPPPLGREVALVFFADDLDALFERVRARGGRVLKEPYQSEHAPMRAGFTSDPEGHVIENVEAPAPPAKPV